MTFGLRDDGRGQVAGMAVPPRGRSGRERRLLVDDLGLLKEPDRHHPELRRHQWMQVHPQAEVGDTGCAQAHQELGQLVGGVLPVAPGGAGRLGREPRVEGEVGLQCTDGEDGRGLPLAGSGERDRCPGRRAPGKEKDDQASHCGSSDLSTFAIPSPPIVGPGSSIRRPGRPPPGFARRLPSRCVQGISPTLRH